MEPSTNVWTNPEQCQHWCQPVVLQPGFRTCIHSCHVGNRSKFVQKAAVAFQVQVSPVPPAPSGLSNGAENEPSFMHSFAPDGGVKGLGSRTSSVSQQSPLGLPPTAVTEAELEGGD